MDTQFGRRFLLPIAGGLMAVTVGLLSGYAPLVAALLIVGVLLLFAIFLRPEVILFVQLIVIFSASLKFNDITVGRLTAPFVLLALVVQLIRSPPTLSRGAKPLAFSLGLFLLATASLIWTVSVDDSMGALLSLTISFVYMGAFVALLREPAQVSRLLGFTAVCAVVTGLWWISSYLLGVDRGENPAGDPNFFSALQVVTLPLVLVLAASVKARHVSLALYAASLLIVASVIASLSRDGLLTLGTALLLIAVTPAQRFFRRGVHKRMFLGAVGLLAAGSLVIVWPALAFRIENQAKYGSGGRLDLQKAAIRAYSDNPALGVGFGGFKAISIDLLRTTPGVSRVPAFDYQFTGLYAHNAYLGLLAELGPVGLFLLLGIMLSSFNLLMRTARLADRSGEEFLASVSVALAVGLVAYAVSSLFLSSETSRVLWLIVGISVALPQMVPSIQAMPQPSKSPDTYA